MEIYEGDIVKKDWTSETFKIYEVIYDEYLNCLNLKNFYNPSYDYPAMGFSEEKEKIEVIGNIYDNIELLEVTNEMYKM